jgi:hypothetical protein
MHCYLWLEMYCIHEGKVKVQKKSLINVYFIGISAPSKQISFCVFP